MVTSDVRPHRRRRRRQRGYTLVVVAMLVTVMTIAVAVVLPAWSAQIRREREEELVFRGLQYAEAIRVFQRRFGRFPNDLKELIEVKPRSIRQLWSEPLTEDGQWLTIALNELTEVGMVEVGLDGRPLPDTKGDSKEGKGGGDDEADEQADDQVNPDKLKEAAGPIIGVRSGNGKTAFRTFFGLEVYKQWRFTYDLVVPAGGAASVPGIGVPGQAVGGVPHVPRAAWIGRPLPGVEGMPNQPGLQPGVQQPGYPPGIGVPRGKPVPAPSGKENG